MGRALVPSALPDDGGGGLAARATPASHRLHRVRGRVRRAGRAIVSVRVRAGPADEPAARRAALLERDAQRRRDGDAASIGMAHQGMRLAFLVAQRSDPVVPGTRFLRAARVTRRVAHALSPQHPGRPGQARAGVGQRSRCGRGRTTAACMLARNESSCGVRSIPRETPCHGGNAVGNRRPRPGTVVLEGGWVHHQCLEERRGGGFPSVPDGPGVPPVEAGRPEHPRWGTSLRLQLIAYARLRPNRPAGDPRQPPSGGILNTGLREGFSSTGYRPPQCWWRKP